MLIKMMGYGLLAASWLLFFATSFMVGDVSAQSQQGSVSVTALVAGAPPTIPAVILSPLDGTRVTTTPLVVSGTCAPDLEVRIFNNQALAGTGMCSAEGTFTINIGLLPGRNELTTNNYDIFNRPGPSSAAVNVYVEQPEVNVALATNNDVATPPAASEGSSPKPSKPSKANFFSPVKRLLGVEQSSGPISTPQTVASLALISALALYTADLTVFGAAFSTQIIARLRAAWALITRT